MLWCSLQCKFAIHTIYSCICHPFLLCNFRLQSNPWLRSDYWCHCKLEKRHDHQEKWRKSQGICGKQLILIHLRAGNWHIKWFRLCTLHAHLIVKLKWNFLPWILNSYVNCRRSLGGRRQRPWSGRMSLSGRKKC